MQNPHILYEMAKLRHKDLLDEARMQRLIKESQGNRQAPRIGPVVIVGIALAAAIVIVLVDPVILLPQDSEVWLGDFTKLLDSLGVIV